MAASDARAAKEFADLLATLPDSAKDIAREKQRRWLDERHYACAIPFSDDQPMPVPPNREAASCLASVYDSWFDYERSHLRKGIEQLSFSARKYPFLPALISSTGDPVCAAFEDALRRQFLTSATAVPEQVYNSYSVRLDREFPEPPIAGGAWLRWPSRVVDVVEVTTGGAGSEALVHTGVAFSWRDRYDVFLSSELEQVRNTAPSAQSIVADKTGRFRQIRLPRGQAIVPFSPWQVLRWRDGIYVYARSSETPGVVLLDRIEPDGAVTLACEVAVRPTIVAAPEGILPFFELLDRVTGDEGAGSDAAHCMRLTTS